MISMEPFFFLRNAHPTSTRSHIQVSGKKVRTVSIGGSSGETLADPTPGDAATLLYIIGIVP